MEIEKIHRDAQVPKRQTEGSAAYDLHSIEHGTIMPNTYGEIKTGLFLSDRSRKYGIFSRSGLAYKYGLYVSGKTGGEVVIFIFNYGLKPYTYEKGDRVAQMICFN